MKKNSSLKVKKRFTVIFLIFSFLFVLLAVRIGYIQFVDGERLSGEALEQQTRDRLVNAKRGTIYDRNGKQLATSGDVETVGITPVQIRETGKVDEYAKTLAEILELDEEWVKEKINSKVSYVLLKKKVEKETADKIREANLSGVSLDADTKRYYPYNNIGSHVIGFTGDDNQGLLGIEMVYDSKLKGQNGRIVSARNAAGSEMPYKYDRYYTPEDGCDITLTIDITIQHFLEKHLEQAMVDNQLQNGAAGIIMDVRTGDILAMATKPDFNLNEPFTIYDEKTQAQIDETESDEEKSKIRQEYFNKLWRNKAVVDSYEPGSTFKLITSAMALDEGVVTINDQFQCNGYKKVGGYTIGCWKDGGHGTLDFVGALKNSCNPAFMTIGERIGNDTFYKYYKGFGFTEKTGIELPGETTGTFYPEGSFNETELATASFGQGPTVTPLQMLAAIGAIANDGKMLKPHLVKNISDSNGNIIESYGTEIVRQVVSEQTANILTGIMEEVVSEGTGGKAYLEGFRVGGKTGTSEKIPRGNGKYVASFAGIAPADDPQVVMILLLDEPVGAHTGGLIAAPLAGKIMDDVLRYMDIKPEVSGEDASGGETAVPDVTEKSIEDARKLVTDSGLRCVTEGDGETVNIQIPAAGAVIAQGGTVIIYTGDAQPSNSVKMPDVLGKTYQEVKEIFDKNNLILEAKGIENNSETAVAVSQSAEPDSYVSGNNKITVEFADKNSKDTGNTE